MNDDITDSVHMKKLDSLDGHLIKWAKNHYPNRSFDDVVRAVCAFPGRHGIAQRIKMLMRAFMATGQAQPHIIDQFMDCLLWAAATDNDRMSSYHLREGDIVKLSTLEEGIRSSLSAHVVIVDHTRQRILELPKDLTNEDFERYKPENDR